MKKLLQRTRRPDISFCRNGRISLSARVVKVLSLQPGDSINVAFHLGECYLLASHNDNAAGRRIATCYPTKKGSRNFCANSVTLARLMLDKCNVPGLRASFLVGKGESIDGEVCLPIIYKMPL